MGERSFTEIAEPSGVLIRDAEVGGRRLDVRLRGERITEVAPGLRPLTGEIVVEARGGALLPGLHDHHIHLLALAAALVSVDCSRSIEGLRSARPDATGWVRGVRYHEEVAGPLDRRALDAIRGDVPVRVQHATGNLWMLNSAAIRTLGLPEEHDGRLLGADEWMRARLGPAPPPELVPVGELLARRGVTGVTDATVTNGPHEATLLAMALPQRVVVMNCGRAPQKFVVHEHDLPDLRDLAAGIDEVHRRGRRVAVHAVTRAALLFVLAAFDSVGARSGDRIEHASVAPPEAVTAMARLGLTVVTQFNFLVERGHRYERDVDGADRPWLYRGRGLLDAGVRLGGGTDAPLGEADPWAAMRAAVTRDPPEERLTPERALRLFTTGPFAPGGAPRRVRTGAVADLCLLSCPWAEARRLLDAAAVRVTIARGRVLYASAA
jgi:predicted amidohydrolase YtcJ